MPANRGYMPLLRSYIAGADPAGMDRELGRIWRVVYTGGEKGKAVPSRPLPDLDLKKLSSLDLVKLLEHPNNWQRRMAQRLLSERRDLPGANTLHEDTPLMETVSTLEAQLAALWTLHCADLLDDNALGTPTKDKEPAMRAWAARMTGERGYPLGDAITRLAKLAADSDPTVRLAVATAARQFVSGALTVNTPPTVPVREVVAGGILSGLSFSSHDAKDPLIPFMYWMALEPIIAFDPGGSPPDFSRIDVALRRSLRRLGAGEREHVRAPVVDDVEREETEDDEQRVV